MKFDVLDEYKIWRVMATELCALAPFRVRCGFKAQDAAMGERGASGGNATENSPQPKILGKQILLLRERHFIRLEGP